MADLSDPKICTVFLLETINEKIECYWMLNYFNAQNCMMPKINYEKTHK